MSTNRRGRPKYRLTIKLDLEWDRDLIEWLNSISHGQRSEAIRDALHAGIGLFPSPDTERELITQIVREAIAEALADAQIVMTQQGTEINVNELENAFGAQLDNLLGSFG